MRSLALAFSLLFLYGCDALQSEEYAASSSSASISSSSVAPSLLVGVPLYPAQLIPTLLSSSRLGYPTGVVRVPVHNPSSSPMSLLASCSIVSMSYGNNISMELPAGASDTLRFYPVFSDTYNRLHGDTLPHTLTIEIDIHNSAQQDLYHTNLQALLLPFSTMAWDIRQGQRFRSFMGFLAYYLSSPSEFGTSSQDSLEQNLVPQVYYTQLYNSFLNLKADSLYTLSTPEGTYTLQTLRQPSQIAQSLHASSSEATLLFASALLKAKGTNPLLLRTSEGLLLQYYEDSSARSLYMAPGPMGSYEEALQRGDSVASRATVLDSLRLETLYQL